MPAGKGSSLISIGGGISGVIDNVIMRAESLTDQIPTALNTPLQLTFGPSQSLPEVSLSAAGEISINEADNYTFGVRLEFGRTSNPSAAIMYGRVLLKGVQLGSPIYTILDDSDDRIPVSVYQTLPLSVSDIITFEIYRDSAGANSGGLYASASSLWGTAPSASVLITRVTPT